MKNNNNSEKDFSSEEETADIFSELFPSSTNKYTAIVIEAYLLSMLVLFFLSLLYYLGLDIFNYLKTGEFNYTSILVLLEEYYDMTWMTVPKTWIGLKIQIHNCIKLLPPATIFIFLCIPTILFIEKD